MGLMSRRPETFASGGRAPVGDQRPCQIISDAPWYCGCCKPRDVAEPLSKSDQNTATSASPRSIWRSMCWCTRPKAQVLLQRSSGSTAANACARAHPLAFSLQRVYRSTPTAMSSTSILPRPLVWLSMNSFSGLKVPGSTRPTASHSVPTVSCLSRCSK